MAQHDNGRRASGTQSGAWPQGHREQQDNPRAQQDQSSGSRLGQYGGQQGGHSDQGGSQGHQDQYDHGRGQQGDNWRERQATPGYRSQSDDRSRVQGNYGGQGSFGGQAADNDYGNRGITESGNFGNYGNQRDDDGPMSGQGRYGHGGSDDTGGQSSQRFSGGAYRHGYPSRSDSTGSYGSSDYGPDRNYGSGSYGGGDFNAGSYGFRSSGDWNRERAGNDANRQRAFGRDDYSTYGQSSADRGSNWQSAGYEQDRYGDNGYQGGWQQGQRGQSFHDPDYHQWRGEQLRRLDSDYDEWRQHRYERFAEDFDNWRANRDNDPTRVSRGSNAGTTSLTGMSSNSGLGAKSGSDDATAASATGHASQSSAPASDSSGSHADKSKSNDVKK